MRVTSESLAITEDTTNDTEIRNDRQGGTPIRTALNVGGDIGFELSYANFEDFFEGAMFNCWSDIYSVSDGVTLDDANNSFVVGATDDLSMLSVGDRVFFNGTVSADGQYTVKSVDNTNHKIEVDETIPSFSSTNGVLTCIKYKLPAGDYVFNATNKT